MDPSRYKRFDVHAHVRGAKGAYVEAMDALGLEAALNMSWSGFWEPEGVLAYERALRVDMDEYPERFRYCAAFSIRHSDEPGYAESVIAKLSRDIDESGAVAVKVWKDLGMMLKDRAGNYVFCDDPRFSPIFDFLAERNVVIMSHIADPKAAWLPLDPSSPHYGYFSRHPEFHWYGKPDRPTHDPILGHPDNLVRRYPQLTFVGCHLASLAHDVREVAAFLDAFPNAFVDTAGRHADLERQPDDGVRAFFIEYQDRILYGTDWEVDEQTFSPHPAERARQIEEVRRRFEPVYQYYEDQLALPPKALRKFYWENAARLFGRD